MSVTERVRQILGNYESDNPGTKANLARILLQGRLGGTGKLVILPVDQGFEHGPARSFAPNPAGYDPHYHFQLAVDAGLNAYAAPLGMIEAGARPFAGQIPPSSRSTAPTASPRKEAPTRRSPASVDDALRLGCAAIGYTIYPGSDDQFDMMEEIRELGARGEGQGPRRRHLVLSARRRRSPRRARLAMDICAYAAHMAALLGAHIIKVKLPTAHLEQRRGQEGLRDAEDRHRHPGGARPPRRAVAASTAAASSSSPAARLRQSEMPSITMPPAIHDGGGNGSIIGRNTFQRPRDDALEMLDTLVKIFLGKVRDAPSAEAAE